MADMTMSFDVDWEPPIMLLVEQFNEGANQIRSFREPMKNAIQGVIAPHLRGNFAAEGPGWQPLSPDRIRQKGHERILFDTGKLMQVAGQLNIWHIEGGYLSEDATAMAWIEDLPGAHYGFVHNAGYPPHNLPQRQWAELDEQAVGEVEEAFVSYINQRIGRTLLAGV